VGRETLNKSINLQLLLVPEIQHEGCSDFPQESWLGGSGKDGPVIGWMVCSSALSFFTWL